MKIKSWVHHIMLSCKNIINLDKKKMCLQERKMSSNDLGKMTCLHNLFCVLWTVQTNFIDYPESMSLVDKYYTFSETPYNLYKMVS